MDGYGSCARKAETLKRRRLCDRWALGKHKAAGTKAGLVPILKEARKIMCEHDPQDHSGCYRDNPTDQNRTTADDQPGVMKTYEDYRMAQLSLETDADDSTNFTNPTPSESSLADANGHDTESQISPEPAVPWYDNTYIIRCVSSNRELALVLGEVVLIPPGTSDEDASIRWECVRTGGNGGFFGLRNRVSGRYLGRRGHPYGILQCREPHHKGWEHFIFRPVPPTEDYKGGYMFVMPEWFDLLPVMRVTEGDNQKLALSWEGGVEPFICQFFRCS